ncbi:MAG: glycosyltransferase [bacterium]|nr:glycosyltransferase [bacterium]
MIKSSIKMEATMHKLRMFLKFILNGNLCKSKLLRVLILYTELAGYFIACVKHLLLRQNDIKILLIHYPVNREAPFAFNLSNNLVSIQYSEDSEVKIANQISDFSPQVILCSGWSNKFYLNVIKKYKSTSKNVVFIDNQWLGSPKQYALRLISPFWLRRLFQATWVPGEPQSEYAKKLGFKYNQIFTGLYVADSNLFKPIGESKLKQGGVFPKVMISVARYIAQKDLPTLWKAFIKANENTGNQWKLNCFGFGELYDQRIQNPNISHHGFVQPEAMQAYLPESGIYVLPSLFEPWGVAVHEMAMSALPMVLSDKIGSASFFLDDRNGYVFEAGNGEMLQEKLEKLMALSDEQLWKMAAHSFEQGSKLELDNWVDTLNKIIA